ncbi:RidA family protein [Geminicoccaceae bacterium 1502E]|nr:RidA family protein [Geminicoccaceae bacterium 1502E]
MQERVRYLDPVGAHPTIGQYSNVGIAAPGSLCFLAGQLAVGEGGEVVHAGDFDQQFDRVFANIGLILEGIGCDFTDVVKLTTYLVHSQDIARFRARRESLFPALYPDGVFPPNSLVVVDRLACEECLIEVEAVARLRG